MELSNKVVQGYVNGELTNIAPATMSDNVFLSSNNSETIDTGLITTYTHTRTGTVNEFTGTGSNGKALMTADVQAGDTFQVNGTPVTAYMGTEDATDSMAGSSWTGKWITFVFDGTAINFKGGGGGAALKIASAASKDQLPTPAKGIGVITTTAVGNAVVSFDEPAAPSAGDVWIRQGRFSPEVQVSKNPVVNIAPAEVLQWDGAAWASKEAYIAGGNGVWVPLRQYLLKVGHIISENAGSLGTDGYAYGGAWSYIDGSIHFAGSGNGIQTLYTTKAHEKKNKMVAVWKSNIGGICYIGAYSVNGTPTLNPSASESGPIYLKSAMNISNTNGNAVTQELDMSGLTEPFRPTVMVRTNGQNGIDLIDWWVE